MPVQGFAPDGTVNYWNLASEELYGYSTEEAIGRNILDLLIPKELQRAVDLFPAGDAVCTVVEIEDLILETGRMSALGMIVNELITNAMKYAFRDHPAPELAVRGRSSGDHYTLVVADNGPGLPASFDPGVSASFGMSMVDALATQLRGTFRFEPGDGTQAILEFPVSSVGQGREIM